jgi:hypothetical protein
VAHTRPPAAGGDRYRRRAAAGGGFRAEQRRQNAVPLSRQICEPLSASTTWRCAAGGAPGSQVVALGKRFSDKLYVEYQQGMAATSAMLPPLLRAHPGRERAAGSGDIEHAGHLFQHKSFE